MKTLLGQLAAAQTLSLIGLLIVHTALSAALAPTGYRQTQALRRTVPVLRTALENASPEHRRTLLESMAETSQRPVEVRVDGRSILRAPDSATSCDRWDAYPLAAGQELRICSEGFPFRNGRYRLLVFVLSALLSLLVALGLARRITRPLEQLRRVSEEIGAGRLETPLPPVEGPVEIRSLRAAIARMTTQLSARTASQRDLLALASHELRSPLARLQVLVGLAQLGIDPAKQLEDMEADLSGLAELVDDVLASSRLEQGILDRRSVRIAPLIQSLEPTLELTGDATVFADATLLNRVLAILIDNAKRHGAPPMRVVVEAGELVVIRVQDAGKGFSEEPSDAAESDGAGLGLALARRIVSAHGGEMRIGGRQGGGAEVSLHWPAKVGSA